ncbi:MAG: hypothetical protein QOF48_1078 [Verrucomicrobiota bacterium]
MGLFKKKHDPIAERAEALNQQIAALEAQIKGLAEQQEQAAAGIPTAPSSIASAPQSEAHDPQPRLRSTTKPRAATGAPKGPLPRSQEPIFEEVDHERLQAQQEQATSEHFNELGVRKYDLAAVWRRTRTHFRGPATTNPKLVNYLAAGSIQGLRPMRYEKRVARNRFIFFVALLALAMWGLIAIFMKGAR